MPGYIGNYVTNDLRPLDPAWDLEATGVWENPEESGLNKWVFKTEDVENYIKTHNKSLVDDSTEVPIITDFQWHVYREDIAQAELTITNESKHKLNIKNIRVDKPEHCVVTDAITYDRVSGRTILPNHGRFRSDIEPDVEIIPKKSAAVIFFIKTPNKHETKYTIAVDCLFLGGKTREKTRILEETISFT